MTNYENIRSMSIEDMAKELCAGPDSGCPGNFFIDRQDEYCTVDDDCTVCWLEWLKQEVRDA